MMSKKIASLSLALLLSTPYISAEELVVEAELDSTHTQAPNSETTPQLDAATEQRAQELLAAYNPQLFTIAETIVAQSKPYKALVDKMQEAFPQFVVGYVFGVTAHEQAPSVSSNMIFSFAHPTVQASQKGHTLTELNILKQTESLTDVELVLLEDCITAWQTMCDKQIAATIVEHPELYKLLSDHHISLNQFVNFANSQAATEAETFNASEEPVAQVTTPVQDEL